MAELSTHIRHELLYEFESGHSAAEACRSLCRVFGSEALSVRSVYSWFERFRSGNRSLEDEPRSGRPTTIPLDELRKLAEQHPYEGVRYFAAESHAERLVDSSWSCIVTIISSCCLTARLSLPRSTLPNCRDWPTRCARNSPGSTKFARCTITRIRTSRRRLLREFWNLDGKFCRFHRTAQLWPQVTTTFFHHFSIIWKGSVMKIVTTSKMTSELFSPPNQRQESSSSCGTLAESSRC
ncbi:unnamed protein product [Heligmosomoides polygyrus]|uniref:HTH_48 domain-containing protein n=1 Tax=Heligmosomoides polygyrus TaxID=6339 RepID=A0A183FVZ6_HELPZ|nr:unnamed protein product [Heligmosomoides polygyrus]